MNSLNAQFVRRASEELPKPEVRLTSDDGYCEEVSTEIDVESFYGTSRKAKTRDPLIEEQPKRNPHATRSKKECPKCGGSTTSGKFSRNAKCCRCEKVDNKGNNSDVEVFCNSPTSEPKRFGVHFDFISCSRFNVKVLIC